MNLNALSYFVTVVEAGALNKAAESLGVSQPALTKAIRRLEIELGAPLFSRTSQGMRITEFGTEFYKRARTLHAGVKNALSDMDAVRIGSNAMVRVGVTTGTEDVVAAAYLRLARRRPALRVESDVQFPDALVRAVERSELDFAILPAPAFLADELSSIHLMDEAAWIVAAGSHPLRVRATISLADLQPYKWVLPSHVRPGLARFETFFAKSGLAKPQAAFQYDYSSPHIVHSLVAGTELLALCTSRARLIASQMGVRELSPSLPAMPARSLHLIFRTDRDCSPIAVELRDQVVQLATAAPDYGSILSQALQESLVPRASDRL